MHPQKPKNYSFPSKTQSYPLKPSQNLFQKQPINKKKLSRKNSLPKIQKENNFLGNVTSRINGVVSRIRNVFDYMLKSPKKEKGPEPPELKKKIQVFPDTLQVPPENYLMNYNKGNELEPWSSQLIKKSPGNTSGIEVEEFTFKCSSSMQNSTDFMNLTPSFTFGFEGIK